MVFLLGICALGPRDVVEVMQGVNEFLDRNPTELIVFIYQVDNNVDQDVDLNKFYDQLQLVDGLVDKLYVHSGPGNAWPTLGQLINPAVNKVSNSLTSQFPFIALEVLSTQNPNLFLYVICSALLCFIIMVLTVVLIQGRVQMDCTCTTNTRQTMTGNI